MGAKSWKTTVLGILGILATVINVVMSLLNGTDVNIPQAIAGVTLGAGLIKAKDHDVQGVAHPTTLQKLEKKAEVVEVLKEEGIK